MNFIKNFIDYLRIRLTVSRIRSKMVSKSKSKETPEDDAVL